MHVCYRAIGVMICFVQSSNQHLIKSTHFYLNVFYRTKRNLHSHNEKPPLSKHHMQVTAYGEVSMHLQLDRERQIDLHFP